MADFLLYGAYGYTGELVAEAAVRRDLDPLLAGRREQPLDELATSLGCEYEAFDLPHRTALTDSDCCNGLPERPPAVGRPHR